MCNSSLFHNLGAAAERALSPLSISFDLGTTGSSRSSDLRHRAGVGGGEGGTRPFKVHRQPLEGGQDGLSYSYRNLADM